MIAEACVLLSPSPQTNWYETMRWFVAGVADAVNVAACFAIGVLGDDVTATPVGIAGAETVTVCCAVFELPPLSVAVTVTMYEPPELNTCVAMMPLAVPSPPKLHVKVQLVHDTPSSWVVVALNVTT